MEGRWAAEALQAAGPGRACGGGFFQLNQPRYRATLATGNPALVHVHDTTNTRFVTDLDTLDVAQLARRTGWTLALPALETTD